jgi:hypothetical protein
LDGFCVSVGNLVGSILSSTSHKLPTERPLTDKSHFGDEFSTILRNCFSREKNTFVSVKHFVEQNISTFCEIKKIKIKILKAKKEHHH